jgi:hypothetical protein
MSERAAALLHHFLGRSIDRAGCGRDRKFKPLVLGEIQAAGDKGGYGRWPMVAWTPEANK